MCVSTLSACPGNIANKSQAASLRNCESTKVNGRARLSAYSREMTLDGGAVPQSSRSTPPLGVPGKPKGFDGGEVERYFCEGKIKEVADYCETDVVGTYQVWLR